VCARLHDCTVKVNERWPSFVSFLLMCVHLGKLHLNRLHYSCFDVLFLTCGRKWAYWAGSSCLRVGIVAKSITGRPTDAARRGKRMIRRERLSPTHFNCFLSPTLLSLLSFSVFSHVRSFRVRELPVLAAKNSQKLADDVVICSTCSMHVHVHCTIVVGCPVQIPHK